MVKSDLLQINNIKLPILITYISRRLSNILLEVAGVEPASQTTQQQVSTCVAHIFISSISSPMSGISNTLAYIFSPTVIDITAR